MLMSSINDSDFIWLSENRNTVGLPSQPALRNNCSGDRGGQGGRGGVGDKGSVVVVVILDMGQS